MDARRWEKLDEIFDSAIRLDPGPTRDEYVRRQCFDDPDLKAEVSQLLDVAAVSRGLLDGRVKVIDPGLTAPSERIGDFELLAVLGEGGMGVVHRARQRSLDREVAVKLLPPYFARSDRRRRRFRREALAAARLRHPSIVTVHEFIEREDCCLLVMECVDGHDLSREIEIQRLRNGAALLPHHEAPDYPAAAVRLCRRVAESLAHAHAQGVLHRDVKPSNILLDGKGMPRVCDFGLAFDRYSEPLTRTKDALGGTLAYMSPERLANPTANLDPRSDVYSLGVVLFELLTLRRPYDGDDARAVLEDIRSRAEPSPRAWRPTLSREIDAVVRRAIATAPGGRYPDMDSFRRDLERLERGEPVEAQTPGTLARLARHVSRHRTRYFAGVALAAVAITAIFVGRRWEVDRRARARLDAIEAQRLRVDTATRAELVQFRGDLDGFLADFPDRASDSLVVQARDDLRRVGVGEAERAVRDLEAGTGIHDELSPDRPGRSSAAMFRGIVALESIRSIVGNDPTAPPIPSIEDYFPRVRIAAPVEAKVRIREIDWLWGSLTEGSPIEDWSERELRLPPGIYRFEFVLPGVGHAEITRELHDFGRLHRLEPRFVPDADALADMIEIPEGPFRFGHDINPQPWLMSRTVDLPRFFIDRDEVTNAEFKEFLDAHPGVMDPSALWPDGYLEQYAKLPVFGVPFFAARAYAEWRGKRLPTWQEWEKAARGPSGFTYPWGDEAGDLRVRANIGRERSADLTTNRAALAFTRPAGVFAYDRSPYGAFDMLGNVQEWTESVYPTFLEDQSTPYPEFLSRVVKGRRWDSQLDTIANLHSPTDLSVHSNSVGFRCAKSFVPNS